MNLNELPLESPIGTLRLLATDEALVGICLPEQSPAPADVAARRSAPRAPERTPDPRARRGAAHRVLRGRAAGVRPAARPDRDRVPAVGVARALRHPLRRHPLVRAEPAAGLGRPTASRAVGGANRTNPVAIIVPCHRVVGADGSLTGYAGGLATKEWLLRHEGARPKT